MKIISKNKKAFFDYEILEKALAGIVLIGSEVKSVRNGNVNLKGSFVVPHKTELFVENMHISPYQAANQVDYNPLRKRKLLLKEKEISKLIKGFDIKGQTIVPLEIGLEGRSIKLLIGLCRGKKVYDKRDTIKKRELDREFKKNLRM
jgi:SsrA-binding protein